jgi:hypothetical protein
VRRPLLPRWLKSGRISIVCMAVMLVTTGCAGGSASHASETRTGSGQVLATFGAFAIPTFHAERADITQERGETLWFTEELGKKIRRITAGET